MCDIAQFYKTKLDNFIKVCYKDIYHPDSVFPTFKKVNNPMINEVEPCFLLNNKKQEYYKHTYDPIKIMENVSKYTINEHFIIDAVFRREYLHNMERIIDMTPRSNCCNCISFTLYSTANIEPEEKLLKKREEILKNDGDVDMNVHIFYETLEADLERLCGYLLCLKISVMNIKKRLEDFVVRIYLDISVISIINKFNEIKMEYVRDKDKLRKYIKNILEYIQYLFSADNVEIYTYLCESYLDNIAKTRALRFLPMLDPEVNVSIVREADGIVSYTDIYNIKNFVTSNKMIFIYPYQPGNFIDRNITYFLYEFIKKAKIPMYTKIDKTFMPYSEWLRGYIRDNRYFTNKMPLFDLLAGLFGIAITVRPEIFKESLHNININNDKKIKEKELQIELEKDVGEKIRMIKSLDRFKLAMRTGFDEIFLLELFKDLYTYNIEYNDLEKYDNISIANIMFILNNFQYPLKKIDTHINYLIPTKLILNTLFDTDKNNKIIYMNVPPIQNEINMYIMDYNIDDIIKSQNITDSCIDIISGDIKVFDILNNILTKNMFDYRGKYAEYRDIIREYGQNFNIDKIVFGLYNDKYNFHSKDRFAYKYLKYKHKYLNLKSIL